MPELAPPPPAPAAASPPTVAPAPPPPASAPPPAAGASFDESFPDDGLDTPPAPKPAPAAAPDPKPPGDEPKAPAAGEPKAPAPKLDADFNPPQVAKPNELRSWAQKMGGRAQKAESELQSLRAKVAQLEQAKPTQDVAALVKEIETLKEKNAKSESQLELTKFERSEAYEQKYQRPYHDAIAAAYRDVKELLAYDPNPDDPDSPAERMATQADFDEVYSLPLGQASRLAKQKFGDGAAIVLQHRAAIRRLAENAYNAVEEYKKKGGEQESQTKAEQAAQQEAGFRLFKGAIEAHAKQAPDLFTERDGDQEGNELLAKGRKFADAVFGGADGLTPQQVAFRDGYAYNRLAAWPRVVRDNKRLQTELAELKKTVETLRGSAPGAPEPGAPKKDQGGYVPLDQAFDSMPG